jgi:flavin-dependent dehydrogenase
MNASRPAERYDVAIVGAGPAGTHLALRLAERGFRTALLDRKRFPRHKPCGEFLSPECLPLLREVGLHGTVAALGASAIEGLDLHGFDRTATGTFGRVPRAVVDRHGFAIRREVLDTVALRAAAARAEIDVFEGHAMRSLLRDGAGAVCGVAVQAPDLHRFEIRARFTIGADGLRSRVAAQLGLVRAVPWLQKFALVARFSGVPRRARAEVHFLDDGYIAACPVDGDLFTLNLVVDRDRLPGSRRQLADFVLAHVAAAPALAERLGKAKLEGPILACGPLARATTAQTFAGGALLGDACGYVDPMTGEGMFFAMRGAALLAPELERALHAGRTDAAVLHRYVRRRRREFGHRYALAKLLQRGLRHPAVARTVLRLLAARPALADLMVAMTGESARPSTLLRPSLWWHVLRGVHLPAH